MSTPYIYIYNSLAHTHSRTQFQAALIDWPGQSTRSTTGRPDDNATDSIWYIPNSTPQSWPRSAQIAIARAWEDRRATRASATANYSIVCINTWAFWGNYFATCLPRSAFTLCCVRSGLIYVLVFRAPDYRRTYSRVRNPYSGRNVYLLVYLLVVHAVMRIRWSYGTINAAPCVPYLCVFNKSPRAHLKQSCIIIGISHWFRAIVDARTLSRLTRSGADTHTHTHMCARKTPTSSHLGGVHTACAKDASCGKHFKFQEVQRATYGTYYICSWLCIACACASCVYANNVQNILRDLLRSTLCVWVCVCDRFDNAYYDQSDVRFFAKCGSCGFMADNARYGAHKCVNNCI